ncbi:hypothetical protein MCEREM30_02160 [Paracoccaceae bacterium]
MASTACSLGNERDFGGILLTATARKCLIWRYHWALAGTVTNLSGKGLMSCKMTSVALPFSQNLPDDRNNPGRPT